MLKIKVYTAYPQSLPFKVFDNEDMQKDDNTINDLDLSKKVLNKYENLEVLPFNEKVIDSNENNFLLVSWLNLSTILSGDQKYDYSLSKNMIKFLKKYNMKLIVAVPRENVLWSGMKQRYEKEGKHAIDATAYNFYKHMKRQGILMLQCGFKSPYTIEDNSIIHWDLLTTFSHDSINPGITKTKLITTFGSKHNVIPYQEKYFDETVGQKKYKFISLLGNIERPARMAFLLNIFKEGLLNKDDLCFSWVFTRSKSDLETTFEREYRIPRPQINPKLPRKLHKQFINLVENSKILESDITINWNTTQKNDTTQVINPLYKEQLEWMTPLQMTQSLMQIVYETRPHAPFLTEKFYKPIISKQPFIWYSIDKVLDFLEEENYKTYSFINYKYDSISDPIKRWKAVYKEFKRLYSIPFEDLKEMIQKENHISEHNYEVYLNKHEKDEQGKRLYEQLRVFI